MTYGVDGVENKPTVMKYYLTIYYKKVALQRKKMLIKMNRQKVLIMLENWK